MALLAGVTLMCRPFCACVRRNTTWDRDEVGCRHGSLRELWWTRRYRRCRSCRLSVAFFV